MLRLVPEMQSNPKYVDITKLFKYSCLVKKLTSVENTSHLDNKSVCEKKKQYKPVNNLNKHNQKGKKN